MPQKKGYPKGRSTAKMPNMNKPKSTNNAPSRKVKK
jgi:hypothetical protein